MLCNSSGIGGATGVEVHIFAQLYVLEGEEDESQGEEESESYIKSSSSPTPSGELASNGKVKDRQRMRSSQFLYPLPSTAQSPSASPSPSGFFKLYNPATTNQQPALSASVSPSSSSESNSDVEGCASLRSANLSAYRLTRIVDVQQPQLVGGHRSLCAWAEPGAAG